MNLIDKLFKENAYGIAIRPRGSHEPFTTKYPSIFKWYADPFPMHHDKDDYVFAEIMDYHNVYGEIAVAKIVQGRIEKFKTIISEPFHMSFPNVFLYQGTYYMIPETYQVKQVRLYKCLNFPFDWELDCVLIEGVELVDHAIYIHDNQLIMLSYDISDLSNTKTIIYSVDLKEKRMKQIYPIGNINQERAAGTIFADNNELYRAVQDCVNCYGDFIKIYKIDEISDNRIEEHLVKEIHADDIRFSINRGIEHVHTFNVSDTYEAIDFNYRKFYPNKISIRIWKKVIRRNRRHK